MTQETTSKAIYLDRSKIQDLISHRDRIFAEHAKAFEKHGIDILANDILSSLSMWEIITQYDAEYNTNFHRNGEDAKSGSTQIELKCSTVRPGKRGGVGNSGWQFHAQETDKCSRYIFAVRRKDNLKIVRLYDIASDDAIKAVRECLGKGRQNWINKGKPNHDAILVPEKLLKTLPVVKQMVIDNCAVSQL
jgi:hypothetical protein